MSLSQVDGPRQWLQHQLSVHGQGCVCSALPACLLPCLRLSSFPPRTLSLSTCVTIAALLSGFLPASVCFRPGSLLIHFFIHSFKSHWSSSRTLECLCLYVLITICLSSFCLPVSEALLYISCVCPLLTCVLSVAPSP